MKTLAIWVICLAFAVTAQSARAQDGMWIQLEAQPSLTAAQTRAQVYTASQDLIAGFALGRNWFAVVMGPYSREDAATKLRQLKQDGIAPGDAFLTDGARFGLQFWPVGVAAPTTAQPLATDPPSAADAAVATVTSDAAPVTLPDETVQEARVSEQSLSQKQKEELQTAMAWAGFYEARIDGAFGRGTRGAMEAWQLANGYTPTGILTTAQRAQLVGAYNAVLDGMDLQTVRDTAAGIEMLIPTGVVSFQEYEPPFARFAAKGDLPAQVLLISQEGDRNRMSGLYEILQTLAVVPTEGERSRNDDGFRINGIGPDVQTYITARLTDGQIKGFALIWPAGDDARFSRIRDEMEASFTIVDGVLDPAMAQPDDDQAVDLVAGLQIRRPKLSRTGFYIDKNGSVLTDAMAVETCDEITIDGSHDATVKMRDDTLGIAVLTPTEPLSPQSVAAFQTQIPRLQSEVAVAGYPYGGVLVSPTLTFGRLADIRGLNGEDNVKRLALAAQDGDAGGPVFDNGGAVLGMLLPRKPLNGQVLPADVSFLLDADEILAALTAAGIAANTTDTLAYMPPETLTLRAAESTVLVSCW